MEGKKVYAAINAVQRELAKTGIQKGQTNTYDKYRFRGIDDVYNALGPACAKAGLVILPRVVSRESVEKPTAKGGVQNAVTMQVEYDFVSAEDGSVHTVVAFGEAMDRGDKATPKAMAAAFKYAAFQAFCIPVEGQPDADQESPVLGAKAPAQAAPKAPANGTVSEAQAEELKTALEATGADVAAFCKHFNVPAVDQLGAAQFPLASKMLAKKKAAVASAADLNKSL